MIQAFLPGALANPAFITKSIGKERHQSPRRPDVHPDPACRWIMEGKLANVATLACDGDCGAKAKNAIGAFQTRDRGTHDPDCRVDPKAKRWRSHKTLMEGIKSGNWPWAPAGKRA